MRRNEGKTDFLLKYSKLSIIVIYNLGTLLGLAIFYPLIPIMMGYSTEMLELTKKIGVSYNLQYAVIAIFTVVFGTIFLLFMLKGIGKWQSVLAENDIEKLERIRKKCINLPYTIFTLQITLIGLSVPTLVGIIGLIQGTPMSQFLKISTVVFSLFSLAAVFSHIFSKRLFVKILIKTYKGEGVQGRRIGIRKKIFIQVVPMFMVAILFTAVIGYARLMEEKGNLAYKYCKLQLNEKLNKNRNFDNTGELFELLKEIQLEDVKIGYFAVKNADGSIISSDDFIPSAYFKYFAQNPTNGDRVYGDSYDMQGVVSSVKIGEEDYFAGVRFENASDKTINFFLFAFFTLLALNIFVLSYFSKSIKDEISLVADSLTEIAEGEQVDLERKLAVVSNDELGDLVIAFNKIQEREKAYITEREEQQAILMEQERLASLGQLIGGIAHNLRTPIMSLSGAIEGLKDLVNEYDASIDDPDVTKEDHHHIAKDMVEWLEKMKPHCSYMSDIITAVKEQTIQSTSETGLYFTVDEIAKRVDILMNHELKKFHCRLHPEFDIDMNTKISGEVSLMVQVLNNLIVNAIDAYEGKGGDINFIIRKKDNKAEFIIKDHGKGIPEEMKEKLFKEMVTTKGKKGTGLGLYMSYSNIKARFKGKMWFESEEGKGTAFHVLVPVSQ